jgi:hypothetical protein
MESSAAVRKERDAFERFLDQAAHMAERMKLTHVNFTLAASVLRACLGADWIEAERLRVQVGKAAHRLGTAFELCRSHEIAELAEVALYLRTLYGLSGFDDAVKVLKDREKYSTTLQQLAIAYRLMTAGATNLILEPPHPSGGRGDVEFEYGGYKFSLESYWPRHGKDFYTPEKLLGNRFRSALAEASPSRPLVATVRLLTKIDSGQAKFIERVVRETLASHLVGGASTYGNSNVVVEIRDGDGSPIFPLLSSYGEDDSRRPSWLVTRGWVKRDDAASFRNSVDVIPDPRVGEGESSILVFDPLSTRPALSPAQYASKLIDQVSRKLTQTSGSHGARIVAVHVGDIDLGSARVQAILQELANRVCRLRNNVAGVMLVLRVWSPPSAYRVSVLYGDCGQDQIRSARFGELLARVQQNMATGIEAAI